MQGGAAVVVLGLHVRAGEGVTEGTRRGLRTGLVENGSADQ